VPYDLNDFMAERLVVCNRTSDFNVARIGRQEHSVQMKRSPLTQNFACQPKALDIAIGQVRHDRSDNLRNKPGEVW
jgi:hypothetical protein